MTANERVSEWRRQNPARARTQTREAVARHRQRTEALRRIALSVAAENVSTNYQGETR